MLMGLFWQVEKFVEEKSEISNLLRILILKPDGEKHFNS